MVELYKWQNLPKRWEVFFFKSSTAERKVERSWLVCSLLGCYHLWACLFFSCSFISSLRASSSFHLPLFLVHKNIFWTFGDSSYIEGKAAAAFQLGLIWRKRKGSERWEGLVDVREQQVGLMWPYGRRVGEKNTVR